MLLDSMTGKIRELWEKAPLSIILLLAALFRLLAAFFSKGFGMHDDHFLVIEIAQEWIEGKLDWFERGPVIWRSFLYPGLHALLFYVMEALHISDPQLKMYAVRFLHALYSLLTVVFGYQLTRRLSDQHTARHVGLLLALFWIFPFMSVRNLIETACIPPLMIGFYFLVKAEDQPRGRDWLLAGILFGLAFAIRFQTSLMVAGVGLTLLFRKRWNPLLIYSSGFLLSVIILLGIPEWIAWGIPFSSFYNYLIHNLENRYQYVVGPWYRYTLLILGIFIPPVSFLIIFGFLKSWRRLALLFWPAMLFFVVHSYFPNKQERFILPVVPFILLIGVAGWDDYVNHSHFWQRNKALLRGLWVWFWTVNTVLMLVLTFTYSKKNRVETLTYLSRKNDVTGIIWESNKESTPFIPKFYLNKAVPIYEFPASKTPDQLQAEINASGGSFPNYIIFLGEKHIEERVQYFERFFSARLLFEQRVDPSLIDWITYKLNPRRNVNQTSYIFKVQKNQEELDEESASILSF